jgi:para-aminobenzoate synthetase / 4-amino-4-deoxychorismate lyase
MRRSCSWRRRPQRRAISAAVPRAPCVRRNRQKRRSRDDTAAECHNPRVPDLAAPDPGRGIFETLLVVAGAPVELQAHLARIAASAHELYGEGLPEHARELLLAHSAPLPLGRVRLTVSPRPEDGLGVEVRTARVAREEVFPSWERAARLGSVAIERGLGRHKWADRARLQALERALGAPRMALLVDARGDVLEASRANLFTVAEGALITPPLDERILPGVARGRALEAARSLGVAVREEPLPLKRLIASREAFLTGSVRGLEPVRELDEARLAPPGQLALELAAQMRRAWIGEGAPSSSNAD